MRGLRNRATLVAVISILAAAAAVGIASAVSEGSKAPSFTLPSISGKSVSLSQIRKDPARKGKNRVVLLNFWATWCPYCVKETPYLQKIQDKYAKQGLAVVGVSLDSGGASDVKPFVKDHKLTYTVLLDKDMSVARAYGVRPIPVTFLIDKNGIVKQVHLGFDPSMVKGLESEIESLLK